MTLTNHAAAIRPSTDWEGTSTINNADQIESGYERIEERLNALGARIKRVPERER